MGVMSTEALRTTLQPPPSPLCEVENLAYFGTPSVMAFQPFDPDADVCKFRNHLPHWRQTGVTYFVTTRLADSVPQSTLKQWTKERDT
jgi:hypothetical protein